MILYSDLQKRKRTKPNKNNKMEPLGRFPLFLPLFLLLPFLLFLLPLPSLISAQNAGTPGGGGSSSSSSDLESLNVHPNYVIIGPRVIRPGADIRIGVTILPECPHAAVRVSASIVRNGIEVSGDKKTFYRNIQDQLLMSMPNNAEAGDYNLTVQVCLSRVQFEK